MDRVRTKCRTSPILQVSLPHMPCRVWLSLSGERQNIWRPRDANERIRLRQDCTRGPTTLSKPTCGVWPYHVISLGFKHCSTQPRRTGWRQPGSSLPSGRIGTLPWSRQRHDAIGQASGPSILVIISANWRHDHLLRVHMMIGLPGGWSMGGGRDV
jgi:hypothetical protein